MGMSSGMGMGGPVSAAPMQETPPDLACSTGPNAATWEAVKQSFRNLMIGTPVQLQSKEVLSAALETALKELKAVDAFSPQAAEECGLGKLCLQLLSFAGIDDPSALPQLFMSFEQLASPVLTLLLDVPWAAVAQSRWPLFGLMAQLNLRKSHVQGAMNTDVVDGLDDPTGRAYQSELTTACAASDAATLEKASLSFLQAETKGSALGPLTALSAQAVAAQPADKPGLLQATQIGFKQAIGSAGELDVALSTQWPLWGLLHTAVDSVPV